MRKKTRSLALPASEAAWIRLTDVFPSGRTPHSPSSRYACLAGRVNTAAAIGRYLCVQSRPVRVSSLGTSAVEAGVHAVSVVFDLMKPFRALRSFVQQFAELWLDPLWKTGGMVSRPDGRMLEDIGITPTAAVALSRKPFWRE
jgi:hypothetical protein